MDASPRYPDPVDSLVGRILGETYEVERRLGVGGFGAVYAAKHVRTGRRYAVKVLRPDRAMVSPGARERFRREAEALAKLGHAGIVRVHDYASEGGIDFLVMDLLEGEDLAQHLHRGGALPQDRAVAIFGGIADALEAAHAADTIHRDLKPGNVFLARVPGEPERPVLLDFGLAKHVGEGGPESLTASGEALGTPHYMAPEQASGESVDARTDVYALGAILFELLVGEPPFGNGPAASVLVKVLTVKPPRLDERVDVPPALADAVERALEKDPAARFPSVAAFREAVLAGARGLPATRAQAIVTPEVVRPRGTDRPPPATRISGTAAPAAGATTARLVRRGLPVAAIALVAAGGLLAWGALTNAPEVGVARPSEVGREPAELAERSAEAMEESVVVGEDGVADAMEDAVEHAAEDAVEDPAEDTDAPAERADDAPELAEAADEADPESMRPGVPPTEIRAPPAERVRPRRPSRRLVAREAEPTPAAPAAITPAAVALPAVQAETFREQAAAAEAEIGELETVLGRLPVLRRGVSALERGREPGFCGGALGLPQGSRFPTVVNAAQRVRRIVDGACEPFESARSPSSEVLRTLQRFPSTLDRAEAMARDRSISTNRPEAVADEVEAAVGEVRRLLGADVLAGRRPFPCDAAIWGRLRRASNAGNVWSGQAATNVRRLRDRVCGRLGLDRLDREADQAADQLDELEGSLRASIRTQERMRDQARALAGGAP